MTAVEYSGPFVGSPIDTTLRFRRRNRPSTPDGVDDDYGSSALSVVSAGGGASVDISNGRAIVQGALYELSAGPLSKTVTVNGGGANRVDILVLRYDASGGSPGVLAHIINGTPGAGPPALTQVENGIWDLPLFDWEKTPAGAIVNLRDRRFFLDGSGGLIGNSGSPHYASPRYGQRVTMLPSGNEYRWAGFWERVDDAPLAHIVSDDPGNINTTDWASTLSGAGSMAVQFIAPLSKQVEIGLWAHIGLSDVNAGVRVRVTGPGGFVDAPDASPNIIATDSTAASATSQTVSYLLGGLTAGEVYTATMQYKRLAGANHYIVNRRIMIRRA